MTTPLEEGQIEIITLRPIGAGQVACEVRTPEKTGLICFGTVNDGIEVGDVREALPFCRIGAKVGKDLGLDEYVSGEAMLNDESVMEQ